MGTSASENHRMRRYRLIAANGHADNHVFWTASPSSVSTLIAMDRWLAAVEAEDAEPRAL
jgi:hypothetical protein